MPSPPLPGVVPQHLLHPQVEPRVPHPHPLRELGVLKLQMQAEEVLRLEVPPIFLLLLILLLRLVLHSE